MEFYQVGLCILLMLVGGYYLLRPKVENEPMPTMAEIKE